MSGQLAKLFKTGFEWYKKGNETVFVEFYFTLILIVNKLLDL